jgi:hypothetical protein
MFRDRKAEIKVFSHHQEFPQSPNHSHNLDFMELLVPPDVAIKSDLDCRWRTKIQRRNTIYLVNTQPNSVPDA